MENSKKKKCVTIFNPFDGRNPDEVWAEIRKNKGPRISREEAMRRMKEAAEAKRKNK